jgi:sulfatase modifying factor 1
MPDLPFDLTDQTIKELAIDDAVARQNVAWFADRYGAQAGAYRLLACYAAMPLVLTPELLNYLHNRFLANAGLPWVAEVDLLLSELVHPVGEELYAMPPATRAYLLEELRRRVGDAELANVARVLLHYTRRLARTNPALDDEELRAQQWAAMVYLDELRPTAVREVAETFRALAEQLTARPASAPIDMQRAEFARLAHITQMLEPQIQAYPELVEYAAMVSRLLAGEEIGAAAVSVQVEEVTLRVPTQLRPLPLSTTTHAFVDVDVRVALAPDGLYTIDISVLGETSTCSQTPDLRPFQPLMERWRQGGSDALSVLEGQTLGRQLYDFLFARDELALFPRTKAGAVGLYGARTRLCLQLGPPELAALPWELLYDGSDFLGQAVDMALLRTLSLHKAASPQLSAPLRLLAVTAAPLDAGRLDQAAERHKLMQVVGPLAVAGQLEVTWLEHATLQSLAGALAQQQFHIFYFSGHGVADQHGGAAMLVLADEDGRAHLVGANDLIPLLAGHASLRLTILNTAESARIDAGALGLAATLVQAGIPAVIGMQGAITDDSAIRFTQRFFDALARGQTIAEAVQASRRELAQAAPAWCEWALPVLYTAAADEMLFPPTEIREDPPAPDPPPITFDWVEIPAGPFLLGSDKKKDDQAFDDELPQQSVTLPAYRIARTPVTVAQFAAFVQATGYQTDAEKQGQAGIWNGKEWGWVKGANWQHPRGPKSDVRQKQDHPVTCVTWQDAVAFCVWASEVTGTTIRLPSEAEWEKAARGTDGRIYPWGNDKPTKEHCNFNMDVGDTTPVGRYPKGASPYGLLDVAGNVWEWTNSLWIAYPYDPADGREDSYSEGSRTVRGGSFFYNARLVRCACRCNLFDPNVDVVLRVSSPGF